MTWKQLRVFWMQYADDTADWLVGGAGEGVQSGAWNGDQGLMPVGLRGGSGYGSGGRQADALTGIVAAVGRTVWNGWRRAKPASYLTCPVTGKAKCQGMAKWP